MELKIVMEYEVTPTATAGDESATGNGHGHGHGHGQAIPLTFLDVPWLFFPPSRPLLLFNYPHPLSNFFSDELPAIKRSLSLCLIQCSRFSGLLSLSTAPAIIVSPFDRVLLTVAESSVDFRDLCSHYPRDARDFERLVPTFPASATHLPLPLLAVQVTLFPGSAGFSLGLSYHHVVGDCRTFHHFLSTWSSLCRSHLSGIPAPTPTLTPSWPHLDRTVIPDPRELKPTFLHELEDWRRATGGEWPIGLSPVPLAMDVARATFVVTPVDMANIRRGIVAWCDSRGQPHPVHLSPYVLACALLWPTWVRTHFRSDSEGEPNRDHRPAPVYFGFIAGGMTRMGYSVPPTYLGNFVGFGRAMAMRSELLCENGTVVAAREIGSTIKKLDNDVLLEAERWISDWKVFWDSEEHVIMSGSPKVSLYDIDFGWGKAVNIEDLSVDTSRRKSISLTESREFKGGIEAGVVLPRDRLSRFASLFGQALGRYTHTYTQYG